MNTSPYNKTLSPPSSYSSSSSNSKKKKSKTTTSESQDTKKDKPKSKDKEKEKEKEEEKPKEKDQEKPKAKEAVIVERTEEVPEESSEEKMKTIVVLAGSSHKQLAKLITQRLGVDPGQVDLGFFSNKETKVEIKQTVRNKDVFVIQSGCGKINDNLMELLILIHACKIASAKRIVAVIPCFPYGRQSDAPFGGSKNGGYDMWQARPGTLVANMLSGAGVDHIITLDLHDAQFQGFFDIPVDNLYSEPLMLRYIYDNISDHKNVVIVSPDSGGAKRATLIAEKMGVEFGLVHRDKKKKTNNTIFVGDCKGKIAVIIDDVVDTGNTIVLAAETVSAAGAIKVYAIVTHGILSGDAVDKIEKSKIDELVISDSVPQEENLKLSSKIKTFSVAPILAEAIRRTHNGESVSFLFDHVPYS